MRIIVTKMTTVNPGATVLLIQPQERSFRFLAVYLTNDILYIPGVGGRCSGVFLFCRRISRAGIDTGGAMWYILPVNALLKRGGKERGPVSIYTRIR